MGGSERGEGEEVMHKTIIVLSENSARETTITKRSLATWS